MNPMPPNAPANVPIRRRNRAARRGYALYMPVVQVLRERRYSAQNILLMKYLAAHDPDMLQKAERVIRQFERPCLQLKQLLRQTIGETHWRHYIEYHRHRGEDTPPKCLTPPAVPSPPPYPTLSNALDSDVTGIIFSFLDGKSMYEASKVCRSFRDALIPRQRNVTITGFPSFEAFRRMNFIGMEFFSGRKSDLVTDDVLHTIANDCSSYLKLVHVDVMHCVNTTRNGEAKLWEDMGPRIDRFRSNYRLK